MNIESKKFVVSFFQKWNAQVSHWLLPPSIKSTLSSSYGSIRASMLSLEIKRLFQKNKRYYNIHAGQRCFILGTGPSINKQDLKPLRNEICIAVSEFYLHPDISTISPAYHVEAPNHAPYDFGGIRTGFERYKKYYSDNVKFFFGYTPYKYSFLNFLEQNPKFKNDNICFLNYNYAPVLDESNYCKTALWDITKRLFGARTVIYTAIQLASYMGFSNIYLLGCDHDYLSSFDHRRSLHFYDDSQSAIDDGLEWPNKEQLFLSLHHRWQHYRLMQQYLTQKGQSIFNATHGGMLDVFPRVDLDHVIARGQ